MRQIQRLTYVMTSRVRLARRRRRARHLAASQVDWHPAKCPASSQVSQVQSTVRTVQSEETLILVGEVRKELF